MDISPRKETSNNNMQDKHLEFFVSKIIGEFKEWITERFIKEQNDSFEKIYTKLRNAIYEKGTNLSSSEVKEISKNVNISEMDDVLMNEDGSILNLMQEMKTNQDKLEEKLVEYGNGMEELKRKMDVIFNYIEEKKKEKEVKPGYKFILKLDRPHDMALLSIIFLQLLYVCIVITFVLM